MYNRCKALKKEARMGQDVSLPFFGKDTREKDLDNALHSDHVYTRKKRNNPMSPNDMGFKLTTPESDEKEGENTGEVTDNVPEYETPKKGWYKNNPLKMNDKDLLNGEFPSTDSSHMMDTPRNHGTTSVYGLPNQDTASALSSENETKRRSSPAYYRDRKPNSKVNGPKSIYKKRASSPLESLYLLQRKANNNEQN